MFSHSEGLGVNTHACKNTISLFTSRQHSDVLPQVQRYQVPQKPLHLSTKSHGVTNEITVTRIPHSILTYP